MGLDGKHVLITGASGGVGLVAAQAFLAKGALVTMQFNSNRAPADELAAGHPTKCQVLQANVTSEDDVASLVHQATTKFGPIEVLVVSHGIWPPADVGIVDMSLSQWRNTLAVNLDGTFLFIRAYLRQLDASIKSGAQIEYPSIVLIGSTAGKFGEAWHADYAVSKTAINYGLIWSVKNEIVKIHPRARINTVAPGWIRTPMAERAMEDPKLLYQALASTPLKKVSEPSDVAQAILFLSDGELSGNITGVTLDCNGGMEGRLLNQPSDF
eukprot:jgi/Hompol1/5047/HPOL_001871-RA